MNCATSREMLIEYSLGQLDASQAREVRKHIQDGCDMCARELTQLNDTWAEMAASLDPVTPSPEVETRLLARIRGEVLPSATRTEGMASRQSGQRRLIGTILAASLVGVAVGVSVMRLTPFATMIAQQPEKNAEQMWGPPPRQEATTGFQTVALNTIAERQGVRVSVVMIPNAKEWHVIATGLPTLRNGESLQIWFENKAGEFTRSATLSVEQAGSGGAVVDMSGVQIADLAGIWLTQEAGADPVRPSEAVLFRASLK